MKRLLLLLFIVSAIKFAAAQPAVDISLLFADGIETRTRNLGLDLTATLGIDVSLGEEALPPIFPPGIEVRFDLAPFGVTAQSYKDYRPASGFPFSGIVEHRLVWQYSTGSTGMTITYGLPAGVTMRLTDPITGTIFNSGILSGNGSYVLPHATAWTSAKLFMQYNEVLPVELTSFSAVVNGNNVNLRWETAIETNNFGFEVERKAQNSSWQKIGFVPGNGNSNSPKYYSYIDKNISSAGIYYYRLKQYDIDGTFDYSEIIAAEIASPTKFSLKQNFPNPFNPSTTISFALPVKSGVRINIYNQIGQLVEEVLNSVFEAGNHEIKFDAKNLSSGIYFYEIQADNFKSIKKMTLLK